MIERNAEQLAALQDQETVPHSCITLQEKHQWIDEKKLERARFYLAFNTTLDQLQGMVLSIPVDEYFKPMESCGVIPQEDPAGE